MIGDAIETFRNTTLAVNEKLVRKTQIETSTFHRVSKAKFDVNRFFSNTAFLLPNGYGVCIVNNAKMNNYLSEIRCFDCLH